MKRIAGIDWKRAAGCAGAVAVLLIAATVAIWPQRRLGYSCGHDFDFHLLNWFEVLDSWKRGLFYPHWALSPNYGAGEPRFVFYPPVTWMLGAALRLRTGWYFVPTDLAWILLAGTGLATWALARKLVPEGAATLAGCAAVFSGYSLFTAYERSAFGELTGGFWIPLALLLILRDRKPAAGVLGRAFDGSAFPLAVVMAGAWLSDVPLGVMASYLLAAAALAVAVMRRSWAPALRAAAGAIVGIGLACFYLVPATWEQKWVDVPQATNDPGSRIEASWMFARHSDPALELHDAVLLKVSIIGASMLAVTFAGLAATWLRGRVKEKRDWWILISIFPFAILFLQLPISVLVWNVLPKLRFLQFPWRWFLLLEAPMGIFFAAALWPARLWRKIVIGTVCAAAFTGAALLANHIFLQPCEPEDSISGMQEAYKAGTGFDGTDEYEPPDADDSQVPTGLPGACLVRQPTTQLAAPQPDINPDWDPAQHTCEATYLSTWAAPEHLRVLADTPSAGFFVLKLRTYPAWTVTVNGRTMHQYDKREDGLMAVPVPQGAVDVEIRWTTTPDVIAGRWLSGIALLFAAALGLYEYKRSESHPR